MYNIPGRVQKSIFLEEIDESVENDQFGCRIAQTADSDYSKFIIDGKQFSFKGEAYFKLLIQNSTGREIVKAAFSVEQFAVFLGFLKAMAKQKSQVSKEFLEIPQSVFNIENVQKVFKIIQETKIHQQMDFLQKFLIKWKKEYQDYYIKVTNNQKSVTITTVKDKMENIEQKIKKLPRNENNIHQIYIGLEKNKDFLENENNQTKIRNIIQNQFRYQLKELIGKGAYGLVYAIDLDHNQNQAIKIQINQSSNAAEFKKCEELQNYALQSLDGDILHFFKCFQIQDSYSKEILDFFIMERGEKNLKQLTQQANIKNNMNGQNEFHHYWNKQEIRNLFMGIMRNVSFLHSYNYYHRDIKYDNIIKKRQTYYLIDFNVSEKIEQVLPLAVKLEKAKDKATLRKQDVLSGTPGYLTPQWDMKYQEIKAQKKDPNKKFNKNEWMGIHDPFKSDIYSMGVVFLQFLNNVKVAQYDGFEKFNPSKDQKLAYPLASQVSNILLQKEDIKVNQYFTQTHQFLMNDQIYEVENLLVAMLESKETDRISTLKLSLICQLYFIVINNFINLYSEYFPPEEYPKISESLIKPGAVIEQKDRELKTIIYKFKNQEYKGHYLCKVNEKNQKEFIRQGYGELYEVDPSNPNLKQLIYNGTWDKDLPHGEGKYNFFQGNYSYIGEFYYGVFYGQGTIYYNNPVGDAVLMKDAIKNSTLNNSQYLNNNLINNIQNNNQGQNNNASSHQSQNTLGLSAVMVKSLFNYGVNNKLHQQQQQTFSPYVIYSGIFYNFILKDWLVASGNIQEENCKYQIRLNANRNEQPIYVTILNQGKMRIIEMTIKSFKEYGQYIFIFQNQKFDQYELNLIQDDCANSYSEGLIYGTFNNVNIFFENIKNKPSFTIKDYIELIKFVKRVDQINFDFVKREEQDNVNFISELLKDEIVKQAIRECKVMKRVKQIELQNVKEIIKEFPFLQELDLSGFEDGQIVEVGHAIQQSQQQNRNVNVNSLVINDYQPDNLQSLFDSDYFGCITQLDFSNSPLLSHQCLIKLFKLKGTRNLKKLNIEYCSQIKDKFFEEWNALNKMKNSSQKGSFDSKISSYGYLNSANQCQNLESLNISGLKLDNPQTLQNFLLKCAHLQSLQELIMSDVDCLSDILLKAAFKNSKIFNKNLQRVSIQFNRQFNKFNQELSYKAFKYLSSPKLEKIQYINLSDCDLFNKEKYNPSYFRKLKIPKNINFLDLSNCGEMNQVCLDFLAGLQNNNYIIDQYKFSLDQINSSFCTYFQRKQIIQYLNSIVIYYDPSQKYNNLEKDFFLTLLNQGKKIFFETEMIDRIEQELLTILEQFQGSENNNSQIYINDQLIPIQKYRIKNSKIFNEIQLLDIPLKIEVKGSISKLIRHEKFQEKTELNLSHMVNVGTEIIDSLVISDYCSNLRIVDLSNSIITDQDISLFCNNGQFQIQNLIFDNCFYITEKGINQILTAKNNLSLLTLQMKGVYRNLGSIQLYDVNERKIQLILDRVQITYSKSQSEAFKYCEVIQNYLKTHSKYFEKMRIQVLHHKILKIFNSVQINYPNVNTLQINFLSEPIASCKLEQKQKSVDLIIQLISKLIRIHHLVLTFDQEFVTFLIGQQTKSDMINRQQTWVQRLSQEIERLSCIRSIHLKQEWTQNCTNQILSEDQIENFYLFLFQSMKEFKTTKLSFKLNMSQYMWNLLKKQKLTDQCVQKVCNSLDKFKNLECLTLHLAAWGHQNNNITNASIYNIVSLIKSRQNFKKINLNLAYWASKNLNIDIKYLQVLFIAIQLQKNLTNLQLNLAGWGQNIKVNNNTVKEIFSNITTLSAITSFNLNASDWSDLSYLSQIEILDFTERSFQNLSDLSLNLSNWSSTEICINSNVIEKICQLLKNKKELRSLSLDLSASIYGNNTQINATDLKLFADCIEQLILLDNLELILNGWSDEINISAVTQLTQAITSLSSLRKIHLSLQNWPQFNEGISKGLQSIEGFNQQGQQLTQRLKERELSFFLKTSQDQMEGDENDLKKLIRNIQQLVTLPEKKFNFQGWGTIHDNISKLIENTQIETLYMPSYQTTEKTTKSLK
ncbi:kinase domain protein (macronuclear) [Tetrahymena thermophila SB210]|uniref:Kinase domain protein n=1 Tax=Tetrahymena thermophila (strain SB210) TaxID=312017 RepID=Q22UJ4_TETTS|nr:kinase domain protein [Tetrahymena thermophila SB210]EAR88976.2 kinase domain protein [Tetrahymena thermophila SB210]|eukprot:XP_001009221.2 kinase domain protein [Tetrahymena thermophila SB210]